MKKAYNDYFIKPDEFSIETGTIEATMLLPDPKTLPATAIGSVYIISAPLGAKVVSGVISSQQLDYVGKKLNSGVFANTSGVFVSDGVVMSGMTPSSVEIKPLGLKASAQSFVHGRVLVVYDELISNPPVIEPKLDGSTTLTDTPNLYVHPTVDGKYEVTSSVTQICRSFSTIINMEGGESISRIKVDLYSIDEKLGIVVLNPGDVGAFRCDGKNWYNVSAGSTGGSGGVTQAVSPVYTSMSSAYATPSADAVVGMTVYDLATNRSYYLNSLPPSTPTNWSPVGSGNVQDSYRGTNAAFDSGVSTQMCNSTQSVVSANMPGEKIYKIIATADMDVTFDLPVIGRSPELVGNTWHLYTGDKLTFYKTSDGTAIIAEVS